MGILGWFGNHLTGAYVKHMTSLGRRICSQCTLETGRFNVHQSRAEMAGMVRRLDDMLALPDRQRQAYSFLCAGDGWMHGPLAIATVDPGVVQVDMHNCPPDRWHGVVDMIDDMTTVVRDGLQARKQAKVCPCRPGPMWRALIWRAGLRG